MDSTQSSTSVPSWPRLQNIRSIASRNFCPGTSPPHSRPALPKPLNNSQLGVRLKIGGHLELRDTLRVKRGDSHAYRAPKWKTRGILTSRGTRMGILAIHADTSNCFQKAADALATTPSGTDGQAANEPIPSAPIPPVAVPVWRG